MTATFPEVARLDGPTIAEADLHARAWKARRRRPGKRGSAPVLATTSVKIPALVINSPAQRHAWRDYARRI